MNKEKLQQLIGSEAKKARKSRGFTQEDAAERIGVSVEFYARIERGKAAPSMVTFRRIVTGLGVSADLLIGCVPEGGKTPTFTVEPPRDPPDVRKAIRFLRNQSTPGSRRFITAYIKEHNKRAPARTDDDDDDDDDS